MRHLQKTLIAEGVGYKFQVDKAKIILNVGFSHPVEFPIPPDLAIKAESPQKFVLVELIKKSKSRILAAKIRDMPTRPYKGKGILYAERKS
jgi:large subunit ribosomal protein L6